MEEWIFTFGGNSPLAGKCVRLKGDFHTARGKMVQHFGTKWAFQYSAEEWQKMLDDTTRAYPLEDEIDFNNALQVMACVGE